MSTKLQQVCDQLIESHDLNLSKETLETVKKDSIAIEINSKKPVIKLFSIKKLTLSDIIPIMHDFSFLVENEVSFILKDDDLEIFVTKLYLKLKHPAPEHIKEILSHALLSDKKESCILFTLAHKENFSMRSILLFRTIAHYENQLVLEFNIPKILNTLITYHSLSKHFLDYFEVKFSPDQKDRKKMLNDLSKEIEILFKEIKDSDDDRIMKLFFKIIQNCVRTNFYLQKESISIKLDVNNLRQYLKGIQPKIEIYVYNEQFRGTHLRMEKVARGGLRYSSRTDDYRLEIKSLMAAQEGKNAIIIPSGAKGGFIIDTPKSKLSFEDFTSYYSQFISALLDLVDNKKGDEIIKNRDVVAYDDDDTYFVVAADRGTSNMSDVANSISQKRSFWIGDAFASGGSNGFHHKKLGITAKGALKSVERFFIEKGINFYEEPISIVGIGSMGGDVFGNGIIQSDKFKLIGAISHDEIFLDPDPDPEISYKERVRLFKSKNHKWSDYDKTKISTGGGVFKRKSPEIEISPLQQSFLKLKKHIVSGEEIANALLKLPVDMIYNGGIGTYIKSSEESNIDVGDKENEYVRVDADQVKAFCICEGGNLGLTQKARYEYALLGGKIHLDSIDNAAGVNTSDHEVNLKIALNSLIEKNLLTVDKKHQTLVSITPFVTNSVLWSNYFQALCIALDAKRSKENKEEFVKVVNLLENNLDVFNRRFFNLPKDIDFDEIIDKKGFIIRPALGVILLYSKIFLKKILNESSLYDGENFFQKYLFKYFPKEFIALYEDTILSHPLRKEIISMIISNKIINQYGATFLSDFEELGKEKFLLKIKAYLITNQLYDANDVRFEIYRSDYKIPVLKQYSLFYEIEDKINYNIKWMLRTLKPDEFCFETILDYKSAINSVTQKIDIPKLTPVENNDTINDFFSKINYIKFATAVIKITKHSGAPFERCAMIFFHILQKFEIPLLIKYIENTNISQPNEALLKEQLQMLLESLLVELSLELLGFQRSGEEIDQTLKNYLNEQRFNIREYKQLLDPLKKNDSVNISDLSVIVNHFLLIRG